MSANGQQQGKENQKAVVGLSGRRFFCCGPLPAAQICGSGLRMGAFWVAVIQLLTGIGFCLYGIFYLIDRLFSEDLILTLGYFGLEALQLVAGIFGLRCTVQKIVQEGLNERLVERLIVWSWLSGLMTILCAVVVLYSLIKVKALTIVVSILFLPVYAIIAFVVWSYKEEVMGKLPDYVGSWTRRNLRTREIQDSLNNEQILRDSPGPAVQSFSREEPQNKPQWDSSLIHNDKEQLLDTHLSEPKWSTGNSTQGVYGAYGQTYV